MNAQQVATALGVTERTVRRAISQGRISAERRGRELVIDLDEATAAIGRREFVADVSAKDMRIEMLEAENAWLRQIVERYLQVHGRVMTLYDRDGESS